MCFILSQTTPDSRLPDHTSLFATLTPTILVGSLSNTFSKLWVTQQGLLHDPAGTQRYCNTIELSRKTPGPPPGPPATPIMRSTKLCNSWPTSCTPHRPVQQRTGRHRWIDCIAATACFLHRVRPTPCWPPAHACSTPSPADSTNTMDSPTCLCRSGFSLWIPPPRLLSRSHISCCIPQAPCRSGASDLVSNDKVLIPCLHVPSSCPCCIRVHACRHR
jgi:hypothetical protein